MLTFHIRPVHAIFELFVVFNESLLHVNIVCDFSDVDGDTEGLIRALDSCKVVIKQELGDEATWPGLLLRFLRCSKDVFIAIHGPLLLIFKHVLVLFDRVTLADRAVIFTSQLFKRELLEGAMVLIKVVESVEDFGVL